MWRIRSRCHCLLLVALLSACDSPPTDRIRFGIPTAPVTLDPRFATDAQSDRLSKLLHRPLVDFDAQANPIPAMATWQQLEPTRLRITLDPAAEFNSGQKVTSADVVATYQSVLDPSTGSPHRQSLANITAVVAVDQQTVDFELAEADSLFPGRLVLGVMAARDLARRGARDDWLESSGPFERVSQDTDGRVLLRRREDRSLVEFVAVKDASVRALKLLSGDLDLVQGSVSPEVFNWLRGRAELVTEQRPGTTFSYLGFNLKDGPTADRRVRLAIAHAIDRAAIINYLFDGAARQAQALFPPQHWLGPTELEGPTYDPTIARALLKDAGYGTQVLRLSYKTSSDYFRLRIATILVAQLAAVGIELEIKSLDWGTFYGDVRQGRFQLYGLSWVGLKMPDIFRYAFHSQSMPPAGANRGGYNNDEVDRLIEAAEAATSRAERLAIYQELQQRLLYDLPYVPLWFEHQLLVRRRDIVGYEVAADGRYDALVRTHRRQ